MSAVNNYEKAYLPSRITAVRIANGYLQERIYHGSNQRIIFEHGIGFPDAAPICITHNFIDPDIKAEDFPTYDEKSFAFARGFLKKVRYNDYDRLIQLADLFSRGKEILSIRQRLDKNKQFYHIKNLSYEDKAFNLRDYFNRKYNLDVEQIVADTFNMHKHAHKSDDRAVFLILPPAPNLINARKRSII